MYIQTDPEIYSPVNNNVIAENIFNYLFLVSLFIVRWLSNKIS